MMMWFVALLGLRLLTNFVGAIPLGLGPGAAHNLPEYQRGSNHGVVLVACKGTLATVTPLLNGNGGRTGCS